MPHLTPDVLQTFFIPFDQLRPEQKKLISLSDQLMNQLLSSDYIVIGAPLAMSSGGIYSEEPGSSNDFVATYLKSFLSFLGMKDVTVIRAEGLKIPKIKESALENAVKSIQIQ
ncbi:FMN-dependent NADH-azoreductase [Chryseobacterium aquaeductus]|uniref:FMN-dependent NADH-azoreductase n=2 Tax=Chryseobacterium aquaeductus TaxID=2675056 RepID=A0A9N8QQS0_9FLAO|nr:FMN-dependent NADH-azoreductase [Chryseobacterium potabilaquae]CAD7797451.1 FMN-dependent NADH-azoreductase [Chryseobacterium aquaeductus]